MSRSDKEVATRFIRAGQYSVVSCLGLVRSQRSMFTHLIGLQKSDNWDNYFTTLNEDKVQPYIYM